MEDNRFKYKKLIILVSSLLGVCFVAIFSVKAILHDDSVELSPERDAGDGNIITRRYLDSPSITLEQVIAYEKQYNEKNSPQERNPIIVSRIFALKHLLISGLMPEVHDVDNLKNICSVHNGQFSAKQQKVLSWFLSLEPKEQEKWQYCEPAHSITDFKEKLTKQLNK